MSWMRPVVTRKRAAAAMAVALVADGVQIVLLPLTFAGAVSPVDDLIDVAAAIALTWLVGWHVAFLPTFATKLIPFVDLVPSWTLAAWIVTRKRRAVSEATVVDAPPPPPVGGLPPG
jgi:hypothetical protein